VLNRTICNVSLYKKVYFSLVESYKEVTKTCNNNNNMFQPLALETLGLINSSGISFLIEPGRRLMDVSGDARETMYLFQRVSLAVERYNSVALKRTFTVPTSATRANLVLAFVFNPQCLFKKIKIIITISHQIIIDLYSVVRL